MTDTVESVLAEIWDAARRGRLIGPEEYEPIADRLAAAHARDQADARRYRWLRAPTTPGYLHFPNGEIADGLALDALDAAIDDHLSGAAKP